MKDKQKAESYLKHVKLCQQTMEVTATAEVATLTGVRWWFRRLALLRARTVGLPAKTSLTSLTSISSSSNNSNIINNSSSTISSNSNSLGRNSWPPSNSRPLTRRVKLLTTRSGTSERRNSFPSMFEVIFRIFAVCLISDHMFYVVTIICISW